MVKLISQNQMFTMQHQVPVYSYDIIQFHNLWTISTSKIIVVFKNSLKKQEKFETVLNKVLANTGNRYLETGIMLQVF